MQSAIGLIETKGFDRIGRSDRRDGQGGQRRDHQAGRDRRRPGDDRRARRRRQRARGGRGRRQAASQVGELVGSHVIPRPAEGLVDAYIS